MPTVFVAPSRPHRIRHRAAATQPPAGLVTRLWVALAQAHRVRRDTRHVLAFSDHLLHDLGLSRDEVERAVRMGRSRL